MRDMDPVIEALEPVVLLSGNPECHSSLLAYLCLPKASGQLISLAHLDSGSSVINNHIAVLIGNLFNVSKKIFKLTFSQIFYDDLYNLIEGVPGKKPYTVSDF